MSSPRPFDILQKDFYIAIKDGDYEAVQTLVAENATSCLHNRNLFFVKELVKISEVSGYQLYSLEEPSPLHAAIIYSVLLDNLENRKKIVSLLLEKGASINRKAKRGDTPLHCAAAVGNITVIRELLDKGAEKDEKDDAGSTPLHYAILYANYRSFNELVQQNVNIDAKNDMNENALHVAAQSKSREYIARKLIDCAVSFTDLDKSNKTPLDIANDTDSDMGMTLTKYAEMRANFYSAIKAGEVEKIKELLRNDKRLLNTLSGKIERGIYLLKRLPPLHYATICGHEEVVELILNTNCNLQIIDRRNNTAIAWAACFGHQAIFDKLIARGADITIKNKKGLNTLHAAAIYQGTPLMIEQLIQMGIDVNAVDKDGQTPLHRAAEQGNIKAVIKLIELGADIEAKDIFGRTPLNRAATKGHVSVIKLLLEKAPHLQVYQAAKVFPPQLFAKKSYKKNSPYFLKKEARRLMKSLQYTEANKKINAALMKIDLTLMSHQNLKNDLNNRYEKSEDLSLIPAFPYDPLNDATFDVPAMLMSRVRFGKGVVAPKEIYDFLKILYSSDHPIIKPILQYVAMSFMLNEKAHLRIVDRCDAKSTSMIGFYNRNSSLVAQGKCLDAKTCGTIMHEICHYYFNKAYHYKSKPHFIADNTREVAFNKVIREVLINLYQFHLPNIDLNTLTPLTTWQIGSKLSQEFPQGIKSNVFENVLDIYLCYGNQFEASEFIVRLPDLIAQNFVAENKPEEMELLKPLARYYEEYVIPDAMKFITELSAIINDLKTRNKNNNNNYQS